MDAVFLLGLLCLLPLSLGQDEHLNCSVTTYGGPVGPDVPCVFPFRIKDQEFRACTISREGKRRPWCPTRVDAKGGHSVLSNDWGYCDPRCPFADAGGTLLPGTPPTTTTVRPSTASRAPSRRRRPVSAVPTAAPAHVETLPEDYNATLSGTWLPSTEDGCGLPVSAALILGGDDAKLGEFPFVALLGYEDLREASPRGIVYLCGGTLVNRRYVLTAAHCHEAGVAGREVVEVVLGEHDLNRDPDCDGCLPRQVFLPEKVTAHENYAARRRGGLPDFDVALIRLARPVPRFSKGDPRHRLAPVCLDPPFAAPAGAELVVVGWGKTERAPAGDDPARLLGVGYHLLQKLRVPLVPNDACASYFPGVTPRHVCAGGVRGEDSCNGDSGGGLFTWEIPRRLVGVVSSGSAVCGIGEPGIYTSLEKMMPWIKQHLEE